MTVVEVSATTHAHMLMVSVAYFGGAFGGLVHWLFTLVFWKYLRMSGSSGFMSQEVYTMALWGLIFCIPLHKHVSNFWIRALTFALVPTLYALLWAIPASNADAGFLSLGISWFTPLFAWISYALTWSIPAYVWVGFCGYGGTVHFSLDDPTAAGDPIIMSAGVTDDQNLLP